MNPGVGLLVAAGVIAVLVAGVGWVVRGQRRDMTSAVDDDVAKTLVAQALWAGGAQLSNPDLAGLRALRLGGAFRAFAGGVLAVLPAQLVFLPGAVSRAHGAEAEQWAAAALLAVFVGEPRGPGRRSSVVVQTRERRIVRYVANNARELAAAVDEAGLPRVGADGERVAPAP